MASTKFPDFSTLSWPQFAVYLVGLSTIHFLLKIARNLFFHPLSKYPGPKLWAATTLANNYYVVRGSRVYKIAKLHDKYGPIIRVGPNELSYIHEDAWKDIYSAHKATGELLKFVWDPHKSGGGYGLFNNPTTEGHNRLRKVIAPAFSDKSVREREGILQEYVSLMMKRLGERSNQAPVDLVYWFDCLGADLSARLTFGVDFNALESSTIPEVVGTIDLMLRRLALSLVWEEYAITRRLWKFYLRIDATRAYLRSVIQGKMAERLSRLQQAGKEEEDIPDLVSYLTKNMDTPKGLSQQEAGILAGDLIVAGGDTSATTLSGLIYHLCTNQSKLQKLTQEIRSTFSSEEEITLTSTNSLKYQIAVFNEGHRLFPAAPESTRRVTNKGGNMICGELIPANVRVGVYHWAAGHNSGSWKDANEFIPERWLGEKEYEDDKRGVIQPFNTGPRNCIGQNLAMSQMRLMLARLIWNFDIELCKESDDWLKMDAHALVYRKRPLMVSLKSVRV